MHDGAYLCLGCGAVLPDQDSSCACSERDQYQPREFKVLEREEAEHLTRDCHTWGI
jgi:hypothetical protein